ncbi:33092_t:CDS:2 [Gigaspora margarita]|uniref:33092_t:CDS:1 n=1 Tax=Gigaspora margarita TaxID=4874 RepID=A0ABN7UQA3_GIGMA|nr:33092_t:CDS:2 [Gigaspora margarita]
MYFTITSNDKENSRSDSPDLVDSILNKNNDPLKNDEITLSNIARNGFFNNLDDFHDLAAFDFSERNLNNLANYW